MSGVWVSCQEVSGSKARVRLWEACRLASRDYTISSSFIHSCIRHMFTEVLLRARHYSRCWGYNRRQDRNPCPHGIYNQLEETENKQDK